MGIPIGSRFILYLFIFFFAMKEISCYKRDFIMYLSEDKQAELQLK